MLRVRGSVLITAASSRCFICFVVALSHNCELSESSDSFLSAVRFHAYCADDPGICRVGKMNQFGAHQFQCIVNEDKG